MEKSKEGIDLRPFGWTPSDPPNRVLPFLWKRYRDGFRIALVETYSRDRASAHIALSEEINDTLFSTLNKQYFTNLQTVRDSRTGTYLWTSTFALGEVRINLFFVKPPEEDCE